MMTTSEELFVVVGGEAQAKSCSQLFSNRQHHIFKRFPQNGLCSYSSPSSGFVSFYQTVFNFESCTNYFSHAIPTSIALPLHAFDVIVTRGFCNGKRYNYHNSGHYPSSCVLFKTQLSGFVRTSQETHFFSATSPTG
jgi:hypothetical protein